MLIFVANKVVLIKNIKIMSEENKKNVLSEEELKKVCGGYDVQPKVKKCKDLTIKELCDCMPEQCKWVDNKCVTYSNAESIQRVNNPQSW